MAHKVFTYKEAACVWVEETCTCAAADDHDHGQEQDHGPDAFELDRPDLDFFDYEPSPYSGDYSEM